jgi:glutaredoxin domain-containing cysteine-rich protein 1
MFKNLTTHEIIEIYLFLAQNFKEKDGGKIVLYTTSMGIVRSTYAKCQAVKQILRTLMVKFEERDVFMSFNHQQEIKERMQSDDIDVPQLFVDGQYVGVSEH